MKKVNGFSKISSSQKKISKEMKSVTIKNFLFKNRKHGTIRATIIDGKFWYFAKDICHVLMFPVGTSISALVRLKNRTEYLTFADDYSITNRTILVNPAGVFEMIKASRSQSAKSVKNWFNCFIFPKSDRLMEQLEEFNEDYCTIEITIDG